jgi:hypothetical protein
MSFVEKRDNLGSDTEHTFSAHHDALFSLVSTAKNHIQTTLTLARLAGVRVPVARSQVQFPSCASTHLRRRLQGLFAYTVLHQTIGEFFCLSDTKTYDAHIT